MGKFLQESDTESDIENPTRQSKLTNLPPRTRRITITVEAPRDSPKPSSWLTHKPTPKSKHKMDLLMPPTKPGKQAEWTTLGFFDQRDWCWWLMFTASAVTLFVCLYLLLSSFVNICSNYANAGAQEALKSTPQLQPDLPGL